LERALALDPGYSHAKALVCRLTVAARSERWLSVEEAARCLPLAEDVVTDHRNDAMALAFAGITIAFLGQQQQRGVHILRQAYALNPNSSHVLYASGWVHSYVGDEVTAIDHFNRSLRINPLDPMIGQIDTGKGLGRGARIHRQLYGLGNWILRAGPNRRSKAVRPKTPSARAGHDHCTNHASLALHDASHAEHH
jgi:tetratricopeptide (TPR) repeat protein